MYAPASVRVCVCVCVCVCVWGCKRLLALLDCVSFHHLQPAAAALAECAEADVPAAHVAGVRVTIWLVFPQFQISSALPQRAHVPNARVLFTGTPEELEYTC